MMRRTQQQRVSFTRLLRRSGSLGLLCLTLTGCGGPSGEPSPTDTSHVKSDRLSVEGDNLMIEGRKIRDQGIATGDDVMKHRGEAMIVQGQQVIDQATRMTDEPEAAGPVKGISHSPY